MATLTCPFCKQPVRAGAKFCARCGRALLAPPVQASHNAAGVTCARCGTVNRAGAKFCSKCRNDLSVRAPVAQGPAVKCPQCGATNRAGARFCAKCRSDLSARAREVEVLPRGGKPQATRFPLPPRVIAAVGAAALVVLVCLVGALVAYNAQGKPTQVASQPSPASTASVSFAPAPQATPTVKPTLPAASDPNFQVFTDKDFGYEITIPKSWNVTALNGSNDGIPGSPDWSVLMANVEIESLQSLMPDTKFVVSIYRQRMASEQDMLMYLLDQVTAQPDEIARREEGKTIEYRTTRKLLDPFGRPTAARWFWDGTNLLTVMVSVLDSDAANDTQLDQALDSVRLLNP